MSKYDDMLSLPHPTSAVHPRMPVRDRAAQFAPFAALTGHEEAIGETACLTQPFVEPDESEREELDRRLALLLAQPMPRPQVRLTWFVPDEKKEGGRYVTADAVVLRADPVARVLVTADGESIPLRALVALEGELFM